MSLVGVSESLQQGIAGGTDRSLVFRTDGEFTSTLTIGQILKGKVLRHYEGGRYGVSFGGNERVVDSTFPLRPGEFINTRVVGVDEKVHLQRIVDGNSTREGEGSLPKTENSRDSIAQVFARYQAALSPDQLGLLKKLQVRLGEGNSVAVSALILSKLGLALEPAFIEAISSVLRNAKKCSTWLTTASGPVLPTHDVSGKGVPKLVDGLASLIARLTDNTFSEESVESRPGETDASDPGHLFPEMNMGDGGLEDGADRQRQEWLLGNRLLNVQSEGMVAHRLLRFPLWFGDKLVEVSLALFAQKESEEERGRTEGGALRYRKAVFALDTDNLGPLEIQALAADQHLRLEVTADSVAVAEHLGSYLTVLESALKEFGWQVDGIIYRARQEQKGPVQAVVEHYITQDSLSRLM